MCRQTGRRDHCSWVECSHPFHLYSYVSNVFASSAFPLPLMPGMPIPVLPNGLVMLAGPELVFPSRAASSGECLDASEALCSFKKTMISYSTPPPEAKLHADTPPCYATTNGFSAPSEKRSHLRSSSVDDLVTCRPEAGTLGTRFKDDG